MLNYEIILTAIVASLWCLGLWTITEPGKLLAFLKQPFVNKLQNREKEYIKAKNKILESYGQKAIKCHDADLQYFEKIKNEQLAALNERYNMFKSNMKLLNPFILCPVCMGSVHGFVVFAMYQPITLWCIPVMVMTAGLNKIWHEKIF